MRDDILAASIRVLAREGALRFTTPRVAAAAGISVGSLYQYFPNKQALLFALHLQIVETTWAQVDAILDHRRWSPRSKVRRVARLFFRAESKDIAQMGPAFRDAEVFFAGQPEHQAMGERVLRRFTRFVAEALPSRSRWVTPRFGAELLATTLESVGKSVADLGLARGALDRWATATADMVSTYLGFE